MISKIDLHCHSTASDGALTPEELVVRAKNRGLRHLALTDHDCINGIDAAKAAAGSELDLIAGSELSATWLNNQIHIVGLFLDITNRALLDYFIGQRQRRIQRAEAIGQKLERAGFKNAYEAVKSKAGPNAMITRGNYARYIFEQGRASSVSDAFNVYLKKGKCAYVNTVWPDIKEAVASIKAAGGVAVLAHPKRYELTNTKLRALIEYFKEQGGEALEVASSQQSPSERAYLADLCVRYDLKASMGSDFHALGGFRDLGLNLELPDKVVPVWWDRF